MFFDKMLGIRPEIRKIAKYIAENGKGKNIVFGWYRAKYSTSGSAVYILNPSKRSCTLFTH